MSKRIFRSHKEPIRVGLTWEQRWKGDDKGLITCWEVGRQLRADDPDLAQRAEDGELPELVWKGGVAKKLKLRQKYGTLWYLAQWQGLRGQDLDIDLSKETELVCSKNDIKVIYTGDIKKYGKEPKKE